MTPRSINHDPDGSSGYRSIPPRPRGSRQPEQRAHGPSESFKEVGLRPSVSATTDTSSQLASNGPVEIPTARVKGARIRYQIAREESPTQVLDVKSTRSQTARAGTGRENDRRQVVPTDQTRLKSARPVRPRTKLYIVAPPVDRAFVRSQTDQPAPGRSEPSQQATSCDPAAAVSQTSRSANEKNIRLRALIGKPAAALPQIERLTISNNAFSQHRFRLVSPTAMGGKEKTGPHTDNDSSEVNGAARSQRGDSSIRGSDSETSQIAHPASITSGELSDASSEERPAGPAEEDLPEFFEIIIPRLGVREQSDVQSLPSDVDPRSSRERTSDLSVATDGHEFFPAPKEHKIPLPGFGLSNGRGARSAIRKYGVGIETEILLKALRSECSRERVGEFADIVAHWHNMSVKGRHPRMVSEMSDSFELDRLDNWALTIDETMSTRKEPWGIEMITPLFVAFPSSQWRRHVQATWNYLQSHYEITDNKDCGTHIHVSVEGGYSLEELKRVAQAAIHFETSFEALVPYHRREDCESARSVWIDSPFFAPHGKSRAEAVLMVSRVTSLHEFWRLLHQVHLRGYSWNFRSILKYYTVEFRKPPASRTAEEALSWAELAISFVQSSIRYGTPDRLKLIPPTVGGLRWFVKQSHVPRLNEPVRLERIWKDKRPNSFVEAKPGDFIKSVEIFERTKRMIEEDRRRITRLAASTQEPYWSEEVCPR